MLSIPDVQIVTPGSSYELSQLLDQAYNNDSLTYFRLSEFENEQQYDVDFGKGIVIKKGNKGTVICYGNILSETIKACEYLDVTILYYHTISPFDSDLLLENFSEKIIICEPFYEGTTNYLINKSLNNYKYETLNIGVPRQFLINYGSKLEHDENLGLNHVGIRNKIKPFIND